MGVACILPKARKEQPFYLAAHEDEQSKLPDDRTVFYFVYAVYNYPGNRFFSTWIYIL